MTRGPAKRTLRRSRIETTLARFEAMDPEKLDADERRFRNLAISALKIELKLKAQGWKGTGGWLEAPPRMAPGASAAPTAAPGTKTTPRSRPARTQRARRNDH